MKLKLFVCFVVSTMLSGCFGLFAVGAAGGMVVYDGRSLEVLERDARTYFVINKAIARDPQFRDSHIVVTSFNENVLLTGETPKASLRVAAEKIAQATPNVHRVYNEITIGQPTSLSQRSRDALITGEIRSKMLLKKGLASGSIRVVTEDGTVYLMGIVTRAQAELGVEVARHVQGVKKVIKVFRYITIT